jgi:hypothetical protein
MADPKKFRDKAERLRKEAAETPYVEARRILLYVATLDDQMDDTLAKQGREPKTG